MTGYTCKYTPVELLRACGATPQLLSDNAADFTYAESLTHANLCCHVKALLEAVHAQRCRELVLVNCCDSVRRAYDVLRAEGTLSFLFLLDLPHTDTACARDALKAELLRLQHAYTAFHGSSFDASAFRAAFVPAEPLCEGPYAAVVGARVSPELLYAMRAAMPVPVCDLTCGGNRALSAPPEALQEQDALLSWYAQELLGQTACMRMADIHTRRALTERPGLCALLYHTVKFCDYYAFEYEALRKASKLPMLKLETDFTAQAEGQLSTRLEAFAETLSAQRTAAVPCASLARVSARGAPPSDAYVAGVDSGSTTTNVVVLDGTGSVCASAIVRTGPRALLGAQRALEEMEHSSGIRVSALKAIVATGYGRDALAFATSTVTEITCHARGAHAWYPAGRTVIDIGGQDSKVICLGPDGEVSGFVMNDKCAAGTGRFLELMARTLELSPEELGKLGLSWQEDLSISSMCTVFAESEVVSLIAENHSEQDIVHGLCKAVAAKTRSLVLRAGGRAPFMMTGGVARNAGVVKALEQALGAPLWIAPEPDLCGAYGAALFAREQAAEENSSF